MDFCRWNYGQHKMNPQEITKESVDRCFVRFCCLVKEKLDQSQKNGEKYTFGKVSGDSFQVNESGVWEYKNGTREMEYCPADRVPDLSTDMFALGLILYELIKGKSFCNEKDILPGLPFEYEDLCDEMKQKQKTGLFDVSSLPESYQEFGYILRELTQLEQEKRIRNFEEFPAAEYVVDVVEAGTGKVLKEHSVYIIENLTQTVTLEKSMMIDGIRYEIVSGSAEKLEYTFLKKRIRLMYRRV